MLQRKITIAHQIANLMRIALGASVAALDPASDPTPRLPGQPARGAATPGGAGRAPVSLPHCVTPCSDFQKAGWRVWG